VADERTGPTSPRRHFRVGDWVRVTVGPQEASGTIIEDPDTLAAGGRRLFRLRLEFDPPNFVFVPTQLDRLFRHRPHADTIRSLRTRIDADGGVSPSPSPAPFELPPCDWSLPSL
jgi:hypothetical protein